jgi:hypothetical protein
VNLIIGLCVKNGTERQNVCKILLSFQRRFISRFNQLVALTSQSWEAEKTTDDSEGEDREEEDVQAHPEEEELQHYDEDQLPDDTTAQVVADEGTQEVEYEEYEDEYGDVEDQEENPVKFRDDIEQMDDSAVDQGQVDFDAAEEDELYEENKTFDPVVQPTEALVREDDVVAEVGDEYQDHLYEDGDHVDQDYAGEEHGGEEGNYNVDIASGQDPGVVSVENPSASVQGQSGTFVWRTWSLTSSEDEVDNDGDDLISYEEAVDQTEEGQDYRQHYLAEQDSVPPPADDQEVHVNGHTHKQDEPTAVGPKVDADKPTEKQISENTASTPKRPLDEIVDADTQTEEPRKCQRRKFSNSCVASKRAKP